MTNPRVLFVAPSAYILGGVQNWLDGLEESLGSRGWDVVIGLVEGPRYHIPDRYISVHPHRTWLRIPCRSGSEYGRVRAVRRAIAAIRPTVVASVNIPDVYSAVRALRTAGSADPYVVATVHGLTPEYFADLASHAPTLDGVFCTNRLTRVLAQRFSRIAEDRTYYTPYGVPIPRARRPIDAIHGRLRIAFAGRLEDEQKRVSDIIHIVRALRARDVPFVLTVAGDGPEETRLRLRLDEEVRAGDVQFVGRVDPSAMHEEIYSFADAFLVTSMWETGPITILEAMAAGIPVVTSNYVGSGLEAGLVNGHNALVFPIGDAEAAATALARLWHDPELRRSLSIAGSKLISERYEALTTGAFLDAALRAVTARPLLQPVAATSDHMVNGRLDGYFGERFAEAIRRVLRRRGPDQGPGGEWPHTHSGGAAQNQAYWESVRTLDGT